MRALGCGFQQNLCGPQKMRTLTSWWLWNRKLCEDVR